MKRTPLGLRVHKLNIREKTEQNWKRVKTRTVHIPIVEDPPTQQLEPLRP